MSHGSGGSLPLLRAPLLPDAIDLGSRNPRSRGCKDYLTCLNFEQSLLKMMTRRKRWSNSACSGWPKGSAWWSKSREEPRRAKSSANPSIKTKTNFRGNRVDTIIRAGHRALLFFIFGMFHFGMLVFRLLLWEAPTQTGPHQPARRDPPNKSDAAMIAQRKRIKHRF